MFLSHAVKRMLTHAKWAKLRVGGGERVPRNSSYNNAQNSEIFSYRFVEDIGIMQLSLNIVLHYSLILVSNESFKLLFSVVIFKHIK